MMRNYGRVGTALISNSMVTKEINAGIREDKKKIANYFKQLKKNNTKFEKELAVIPQEEVPAMFQKYVNTMTADYRIACKYVRANCQKQLLDELNANFTNMCYLAETTCNVTIDLVQKEEKKPSLISRWFGMKGMEVK